MFPEVAGMLGQVHNISRGLLWRGQLVLNLRVIKVFSQTKIISIFWSTLISVQPASGQFGRNVLSDENDTVPTL
jgi:hypothetical protein